jgi:HEAT repeat protein
MSRKDILREFRASQWPSTEAVAEFIARAQTLDTAGVQELLSVLLDRKAVAEGRSHGLRCIVFGRIVAAQGDKENFLPMVRAARAADTLLLRALTDLLPRVNSIAHHPELVQLFRSANPEVRALAMEVTAKVGGKTAFGLLQELVAEPEMAGRAEAVETLVRLAGHHAVPGLRAALPHARRDEKLRIIELLGDEERTGKHRDLAATTLLEQFGDEDPHVARAAMIAYGAVGDMQVFVDTVRPRAIDARPQFVLLVVDACKRFREPPVVDLLRELFLLGPRTIRFAVLDAFRVMNDPVVLPVVVEALEHRHLPVRMKAAEVLQGLGANGTVDLTRTILWLLRSRDVEVKRIAADVARQIQDEEGRTWPLLLRYLRDED